MADTLNLLPCPMCGSADIAHETFPDDNSRDFVMCNGCGLLAQRCDCEADPVEVWNRRSTDGEISRARQGEPVYQARAIQGRGWHDVSKDVYAFVEDHRRRTLYRAATNAAAPADAPKDHVIREAINQLRDVAVQFHATQQLRARIADIVLPLVKGRAPAEDAREQLPDELFDGHAVYSEITRRFGPGHGHDPDTVSATLDAIARLIRSCRAAGSDTGNPAAPEKAQACTYPKCNCPFDAPSDPSWCARGLPRAHQEAQAGEQDVRAVPETDCFVCAGTGKRERHAAGGHYPCGQCNGTGRMPLILARPAASKEGGEACTHCSRLPGERRDECEHCPAGAAPAHPGEGGS